ncbi:MAG TPA: GNAT family N-acetyltransferase [Burkholderiaceae bacterium]|nr:GNAT family N-acetyltransferase [Burkholderiaceae bacterium]
MAETATLTLRAMAAPDLPAYKALRDLLLAAHPEAFSSDAETERDRAPETYLARVAGPGSAWPFTLCAWRTDRLAGAITCEREPRVKTRHIGHVVGMMVHPDARGVGVGGALLDACIARCRASGEVELLTLSVTAGNGAAARLYQRAGFVPYGRLERAVRVGDRYHAKDLMVLDLYRAQ